MPSSQLIDQEILSAFREETQMLLDELEDITEKLEEQFTDFPSQLLATFSQRIDRVMGAAKTLSTMDPDHLGLKRIGAIAEICKRLGYTAAEAKITSLLPIFSAFWADTIEVMSELLNTLENAEESNRVASSFSSVLQKRLEWLAGKVQAASKSSLGLGELMKLYDVKS